MNTHTFRNVLTGAIAASLMTGVSAAHAGFDDPVYYEDFVGVSTPQDAGWQTPIESVGEWVIDDSDRLLFQISGGQAGGGVAFFDGNLDDGSSAQDLVDYRLNAPFARSTDSMSGLIARYQDEENFYVGFRGREHLDGNRGYNELGIARVVDGDLEVLDMVTEWSTDDMPRSGILDMTLQGDDMTLSLFEEAGDEDPTHSVTVTDDTFTSGTFGGFTQSEDNAAFAIEEITAYVPEPGSLALLGAGAGLMFVRRRR